MLNEPNSPAGDGGNNDDALREAGVSKDKTMADPSTLSPREIVAELDRYIIGQKDAKRAVAVALRNRWRRQQLPEDLRAEVTPKNILMIGPTGVGKTEISPPAGQARPGAVHQGRSDQVHRSRLCRPRRRADDPRPRRERHCSAARHPPRCGQAAGARQCRGARARCAGRRQRRFGDPRFVPQEAAQRRAQRSRDRDRSERARRPARAACSKSPASPT